MNITRDEEEIVLLLGFGLVLLVTIVNTLRLKALHEDIDM